MKTINRVFTSEKDSSHTINEIVEYNGSKFKIHTNIRNGGSNLNVKKMDGEGIFQLVLSESDVDYPLRNLMRSQHISYVSEKDRIEVLLNNGIKEMKKVLEKVYK
jgi:hypothetical protein